MLLSYFVLLGALTTLRAQEISPTATFRLYADYESEPPDPVRRAMQEELESIMTPIGWPVDWVPLGAADGEASASLAVVHFAGICDVGDGGVRPGNTTVLGSTYVSDGHVLPYSNVDCSAVRAFLAPELTCVRPRRRRATFGRALGRVLAHELYHVLTGEQRHGSSGVGEARFTPMELSAEKFRFARPEVRKLRLNLLPVLMSTDAPPSIEREATSVFVTSGCAGCHG